MLLAAVSAHANNLTISSVTLVNQSSWTVDVQFNISWDNSWYFTGAPTPTTNWDAAWVFVKFSTRTSGSPTWSPWKHASLLGSGDTIPAGAQEKYGDTDSVHKGVFLYRVEAGTGTNTWTGTALRWDFGTDGVSSTTVMAAQVFGIEMVYVSSGPFYVGSGGSLGFNEFYQYPRTTDPYLISSEGAITVGTTNGNLYYSNGGYGGDQTGPVPADFPKGFNAFYVMKSEISQRQYCDFLNALTSAQASSHGANLSTYYVAWGFGTYRNWIKLASNGKYGTDADNDAGAWGSADYSKMNESNDGGWTSANHLLWMDLVAYTDWAALRPMTELEFEKAARGPKTPVADEYAWGSTSIQEATGISSTKTSSEKPSNAAANCVYNNNGSVQGPLRSGSMAQAATTRVQAGAGYYGALDLSGNNWERTVTVGHSTGRAFTGLHGDGVLSAVGASNVTAWPSDDGIGTGYRGGGWDWDSRVIRLSDRYTADYPSAYWAVYPDGGRCARTAP